VFLDVAVSDSVDCSNNNILGFSILRELVNCIIVSKRKPCLPGVHLRDVTVVINSSLTHNFWKNFSVIEFQQAFYFTITYLLKESVIQSSVLSIHSDAKRPTCSEHEAAVYNLNHLLFLKSS